MNEITRMRRNKLRLYGRDEGEGYSTNLDISQYVLEEDTQFGSGNLKQ